jgi:EmrB/QacA subfamily drug resistance transporter
VFVSALAFRLRPTPNRTLATLSLASLTFALLQSLISPALVTMQHALGTSETGIAWVPTAYLLSASVATPVLGRLGDIHGKRRLLTVSLAGLAVGTAVAALATNVETMIAGRVIQGLGGGIFPLAFGIIRDEFPREKVAGSIGFISALLGLGAGLGVVLSGVIIDFLDYHWLYWLPCVAAVVAVVGTIAAIPESPDRAPGRINWLGATLMSLGLTAVLFAVSKAGTWGWGAASTLGLFVAGIAVLTGWVATERRSSNPLVDMRVMAIRGVWTTNLLAVAIGASMFIAFILIPQFAQAPSSGGYGFDASVTGAGAFLVPLSLVMLVVGAYAGRIEARFGSKASATAGTGFILLAFVLLLTEHQHVWSVLLASAVLGVGVGLAFAAMANLIVEAVPASQTGVASGINAVSRTVGSAFGGQVAATFLAGSIVAGRPGVDGFDKAFLMAIVAVGLGLVAIAAHPGRARPAELRVAPGEDERVAVSA